jgi:flagellar protein FliS
MKNDGLNIYKQTRIKTAGQSRLIVMLYDEAIRQIDLACQEMEKPDRKLDVINNAIVKAQDIITELTVSLDFEKGGEIAKNLFSLYMFFNQQLVNANVRKDSGLLKEIRKFMAELRAAWQTIEGKTAGTEPGSHSGVNIAG